MTDDKNKSKQGRQEDVPPSPDGDGDGGGEPSMDDKLNTILERLETIESRVTKLETPPAETEPEPEPEPKPEGESEQSRGKDKVKDGETERTPVDADLKKRITDLEAELTKLKADSDETVPPKSQTPDKTKAKEPDNLGITIKDDLTTYSVEEIENLYQKSRRM